MVYRTVRLLVDPEVSSQAAKNGQITVIAHEIAHQCMNFTFLTLFVFTIALD